MIAAARFQEAVPSTPVEILGLEGMPDAGDTFSVVADRDKAKGIAQYRKMKERESQLAKSSRVSLEGLAEQIKQAGVKELPLILKGDVTGSVEVLADSLQKMSTEKVRIKVLHTGVGAITESDILLASASNAIVIGFNVRPERKAADLAEQDGVEIRLHSIIYELQDEIKKAMLGTAGADDQGELRGPGAGAQHLQDSQGGYDCRLPRGGRLDQARCGDSPDARWSTGLQGQALFAEALQGRRARGDQWHGVRHGHRRFQ